MRMKGETTDELIAAAEVMQQLAHHIELGTNLTDIVGTGGDGKTRLMFLLPVALSSQARDFLLLNMVIVQSPVVVEVPIYWRKQDLY